MEKRWKTLRQIWEETPKDQFPVPLVEKLDENTESITYLKDGQRDSEKDDCVLEYLLGPAFPNFGFWMRSYYIEMKYDSKYYVKETFYKPEIVTKEGVVFRVLNNEDSEIIKKSLNRFK